jgi:hypothetical protein
MRGVITRDGDQWTWVFTIGTSRLRAILSGSRTGSPRPRRPRGGRRRRGGRGRDAGLGAHQGLREEVVMGQPTVEGVLGQRSVPHALEETVAACHAAVRRLINASAVMVSRIGRQRRRTAVRRTRPASSPPRRARASAAPLSGSAPAERRRGVRYRGLIMCRGR